MGTTLVHFHILGSVPFLIQMLKSLVTDGAIEWAVAFSIRAKMLSGPLALLTSSELKSSTTSSSWHRRSSGHWSGSTGNLSRSDLVRGGCWWLKHEEKKSLALSTLELAAWLFCWRVQLEVSRGPWMGIPGDALSVTPWRASEMAVSLPNQSFPSTNSYFSCSCGLGTTQCVILVNQCRGAGCTNIQGNSEN